MELLIIQNALNYLSSFLLQIQRANSLLKLYSDKHLVNKALVV